MTRGKSQAVIQNNKIDRGKATAEKGSLAGPREHDHVEFGGCSKGDGEKNVV